MAPCVQLYVRPYLEDVLLLDKNDKTVRLDFIEISTRGDFTSAARDQHPTRVSVQALQTSVRNGASVPPHERASLNATAFGSCGKRRFGFFFGRVQPSEELPRMFQTVVGIHLHPGADT